MTRNFKEGESCKECGTSEKKFGARGLCVNCYARTLRRENPEKYRENNRKHEQTDKRKNWLEEYKKGDVYKTMMKKSSKKHRETYKEKCYEATRQWRLKNPDKLKEYELGHRDVKIVKKYGTEALKLMLDCEYVCQKCGSDKRPSVHHIDWDDTNNVYENFAILCGSCHSALHKFVPVRFRLEIFAEWMEKDLNNS